MKYTLVNGTELLLEPGPGWSWSEFDGQVSLMVSVAPLKVSGESVATPGDLNALNAVLIGKSYTTPSHTVPGTVMISTVDVDEASTNNAITLVNSETMDTETSGSFEITVLPAKTANGVPDASITKKGTWRVLSAGQTSLSVN